MYIVYMYEYTCIYCICTSINIVLYYLLLLYISLVCIQYSIVCIVLYCIIIIIVGLPLNEAQQLKYYYHFREPQNNDVNKVLNRS